MERFDRWVDAALYGPDGFYSARGRAGVTDGDFVTSPEAGPLFAEVIAAWLDRCYLEMDRPAQFVVIEGGAGVGTLARDVCAAVEHCRGALRYVMVERSDLQRQIALEQLAGAFADQEEMPVAALRDLPEGTFTGVVLANELLDNLAPRVVERTSSGWAELFVDGGAFCLRPLDRGLVPMANAVGAAAAVGDRVPLHIGGAVWLKRARRCLERGVISVFDYGAPTDELIGRGFDGWARTYRRHQRGLDLLDAPGSRDITFDVAIDQLQDNPVVQTQAAWMRSHGIDEAVADATAKWEQGRSEPTAAVLAARARLDEAATLLDPDGLGGFFNATWTVG